MIIYSINGAELYTITVDDSSYRNRVIMGEDLLSIDFAIPGYVDIPVGSYVEYKEQRYTLFKPQNFKKLGNRDFEYGLILNSDQSLLEKYKFRNLIDKRLKFSLTAKPIEHLQLLVDNLNARSGGWSIGTCIDATEKVISYNMNYCNEALRAIAEAFETEFEVVGKVISLKKVEYNKEYPLALSYGRGNGLKPGVGRSNFGNSKPVEILFVQGGERNIDKSTYGTKELLLPKNKTIGFDGNLFETELGYNAAIARIYKTDIDGLFITRNDKALSTYEEDSKDLSNIYPSYVGTVTGVNVVDATTNLYDFIDTTPGMPDFWANRIAGETMTVIFQDRMLAGKEFDINNYIHSEKRFELVPQELDGEKMPGGAYLPEVGGKYVVFGISLPAEYICHDETKTGASWDMFREAVKYLYQNEDDKFTFSGELDGVWANGYFAPGLRRSVRIVLGGFILFSDPQFQPAGVLIRIKGIKESINSSNNLIIDFSS